MGPIQRYSRLGIPLVLAACILFNNGHEPPRPARNHPAPAVSTSGVPVSLSPFAGNQPTSTPIGGPAPGGGSATATVTATPAPSGDPITVSLNIQAGEVYGIGMPVAVSFSAPIPDNAKADIERRLSVSSQPSQPGGWRWYGDQQVIYRPKDYWQPGTKVTVNPTLGGLPVAGQPIDTDQSVTATIGPKTTFQISDVTKQMQVFQNDTLVKTFPVSLGAPDTPTSTGNMVIMTRERSALWVYSADDQLEVSYAERLTGDGEYIHAAPWSVADQGHDDVSHGCTNLSTDDAEWVYDNSHIGDPVAVSGTAKHLDPGNGWTVWDISWADYVQGSALAPHTK